MVLSDQCGGGDAPFLEWARPYAMACAVERCDPDGDLNKKFCSECGVKRGEPHLGEKCQGLEAAIKTQAEKKLSELISLNEECPYPYQYPGGGSGVWDENGIPTIVLRKNRWAYWMWDQKKKLWGSESSRKDRYLMGGWGRTNKDYWRHKNKCMLERVMRNKEYVPWALIAKVLEKYDPDTRGVARYNDIRWALEDHNQKYGVCADGPFTPVQLDTCRPLVEPKCCFCSSLNGTSPYIDCSVEIGHSFTFRSCGVSKYTKKGLVRKAWFPDGWVRSERASGYTCFLADNWRNDDYHPKGEALLFGITPYNPNKSDENVVFCRVPTMDDVDIEIVCDSTICQDMADWLDGKPENITEGVKLNRPSKGTLLKYPEHVRPVVRAARFLEYEARYKRKVG